MMYKVIVTEPAQADLKKAVMYIANELRNETAAENLIDEAERAFSSLSDMPERNPVVMDGVLATQDIRMVQIKNYLAFYVVREETQTVSVIRFLYARRDWMNILKQV